MAHLLEKTPGPIRQVIAYLLVAAIGYVDYATGSEVSIQFFYLVPITLLAWFGKPAAAVVMGVLCAAAVLLASTLEPHEAGLDAAHYWNAAVSCATFVAYGLVTSTLRGALARLRELSKTDPLTEIHNRRSFIEVATAELARARRSSHAFSMMYIDLDNFKHVNDTLGHVAGDSLLRTVGAELRAATRVTDVVARLGGDEFAVLLPETAAEGAVDVAGKVRARLLACMSLGGWPVTLSVGVVSCAKLPEAIGPVIDAADRLMYSVKKSGKNGLAAQTI
jgi:diguanylate cyclase (GGDEF)-like protein